VEIAKNKKDDQRLLRHIIRCLLRLSENKKANASLHDFIPDCIKSKDNNIITDDQVKKWHLQLLENLNMI
jgi:CCR4-NOT transcription complex subunit 9